MNKYFSHNAHARMNSRILSLRADHGWEGYGLYFALLEILSNSSGYRLSTKYNPLAFDLHVDVQLLKSVIHDYDLFHFTEDDAWFYSETLTQTMLYVDEKSQRAKKAASKRWNKGIKKDNQDPSSINKDNNSDATVMQMHDITDANAMQMQADYDANKIKQNNRKQNNKKQEKIKNTSTPQPPTSGDYGNDKNRSKLHTDARRLFEEHYQKIYEVNYYWTARDAGSLSALLKKLYFSCSKCNCDVTDDLVLASLSKLLVSINSGWIYENLSLSILNSKYNEIISQIKAKNYGQTPNLTNTQYNSSREWNSSSRNATADKRRERDDLEKLADAILQSASSS